MAKLKNDNFSRGFSGKLGGLVFRQCNGRTIIACAPRKSDKAPTDKQIMHRRRFSQASSYARRILQDPEIAAKYAARAGNGKTAYTLAVQDYLRDHPL